VRALEKNLVATVTSAAQLLAPEVFGVEMPESGNSVWPFGRCSSVAARDKSRPNRYSLSFDYAILPALDVGTGLDLPFLSGPSAQRSAPSPKDLVIDGWGGIL